MAQTTQINIYLAHLDVLDNATKPDDVKRRAILEISENLDAIALLPQYPMFLAKFMKITKSILLEGPVQFISEYNIHQIRKVILEILKRLPIDQYLKPHMADVMQITLKLLETDNEENGLICLQIMPEFRRKQKPAVRKEILPFLQFVNGMYSEFSTNYVKVVQAASSITVRNLYLVKIKETLPNTFIKTAIHTNEKDEDGSLITYNLLPTVKLSLKFLQKVPPFLMTLRSLYKHVVDDVSEIVILMIKFITINTIVIPHCNREILLEFVGAQVKCLMFVAYSIKDFIDIILSKSAALIKGIMDLIRACPTEATHYRKEIFIYFRYFILANFQRHFLPHIDQLLDEEHLFGSGYTTNQFLRPFVINVIGDFIHQVRLKLTLSQVTKAVNFFIKILNDPRLPANVENLLCKSLQNLIERLKNQFEAGDRVKRKEILQKILAVFVLKLETIVQDVMPNFANAESSQNLHQNIVEYKNIVKWIVLGVQEIVRFSFTVFANQLESMDTLLFARFLKWGLQSLNLYMIGRLAMDAIPKKTNKLIQYHETKLKEEKQLLESFASIFILMDSTTFHKIFTTEIDFVVGQVIKNKEFLVIINYLASKPGKSLVFGTIMIEYLLEKMDQMGSNSEMNDLYLTLFKIIFKSVASSSEENKEILCSSLHKIVQLSLDLAVNAKEPLNYFLILQALYRSINEESQNNFSQEFLPLLSKLVMDLSKFQTESHKQEMQEILVELFLLIPIDLCFLSQHLEKLMITIVHSLNGSDELISNGLKILDLCISNLEFPFFQNYFQIVATDLVQGLCRIVRESRDDLSQTAFEILGKLGGENRKVLTSPQKLQFADREMNYPSVGVHFENSTTVISFSVKTIIETAFSTLNSDADLFYKEQSWRVINSYLSATIKIDDDRESLIDFCNHSTFRGEIAQTSWYVKEDLAARDVQKIALSGLFIAAAEGTCVDPDQSIFETMLSYVRHYTMIFVASQICSTVADPIEKRTKYKTVEEQKFTGQNPLVLIDALKDILKHGKKDFFRVATHVLETILKTASSIVGPLQRVCQFPFVEYLFEEMTSLCYENPWYSKLGGYMIIEFFIQKMPLKWLLAHLIPFVRGLIFAIKDLNEGISFGTTEEAKATLEKLLRVCLEKTRSDPEAIIGSESGNEFLEIDDLQKNAIDGVTQELMPHVISSCTNLRKEVMKLLCLLAEIRKVSIIKILEPHRELLADVIPPLKLRMIHQPVDVQIGILDGNTFCQAHAPSLFNLQSSVKEHKTFYDDVVRIIEKEDDVLAREPCYKDHSDFIPLKVTAIRTLTYFFSVKSCQGDVITTLINSLKSPNPEIQKTALECFKKLPSISPVSRTLSTTFFEPYQKTLESQKKFNLSFLTHFAHLVEIFPVDNDRFYTNLIVYLEMCLNKLKKEDSNIRSKESTDERIKRELDKRIKDESEKNLIESEKQLKETERNTLEKIKRQNLEEKRKHAATSKNIVQQILKIIQILQNASVDFSKFIPKLCQLFLQTEKDLKYRLLNPFKLPFARCLAKHSFSTVEYLLNHTNIKNEEYGLFLEFLLITEEGTNFKEELKTRAIRLMQMFLAPTQSDLKLSTEDKIEIRFRAIRIVSILIESDQTWLVAQNQLTTVIKQIWYRQDYINHHQDIENVKYSHLIEPKLLLKVFIHYLRNNRDDYDFLFNILQIFRKSFVTDVTMLNDFLEKTVAQTYDIQWKRTAFSKFIGNFLGKRVNDDLKADILQYVVYKCFEASFKKGEAVDLLGSPPDPDADNPNNLIPMFINKVIDMDNPSGLTDRLRINIYRFSCLLIEHASEFIHSESNKCKGTKLRRLVYFAWPYVFTKNCIDPISKYHGHLMLSHIIRKFSIAKSIITDVFNALMQSHAAETKHVVKEALDILIPIFPHRMENGYSTLAQCTKKLLIERSHSRNSLCHCLQFVVKHFKIYYSMRHYLIPTLVNSMKKLAEFSSIDNKKLAIDIVEIIVEWEIQAKNEETNIIDVVGIEPIPSTSTRFRRNVRNAPTFVTMEPQSRKRIETFYIDKILNFAFKQACELHGVDTLQGIMDEQLARRSAQLVRKIFAFGIWSQDGKFDFGWLNKILSATSSAKIHKVLEFLAFLVRELNEKEILYIFSKLENSLTICASSCDRKILTVMQEILIKLMSMFPIGPISSRIAREKMLKNLYKSVKQVVRDNLTEFERNEALPELVPCLMMAKALYANNARYLDPLMTNLVNVFQMIVRLRVTQGPSSETEEELFILLDILSNRTEAMSSNSRQLFLTSLKVLIISTSCTKTIKSILNVLKDWVDIISDLSESQRSRINQKIPLFIKMFRKIDKQFPEDLELRNNFLEVVYLMCQNKIYQSVSALSPDLEVAFLEGLRSDRPEIRIKFSAIVNESVERTLKSRFEYIVNTFNWHLMGPHYWIKQCIEFLLIIADPTTRIQVTNENILLPSVKDFIKLIKKEDAVSVNISDLNPTFSDLNVVLSNLESKENVLNLERDVDLLAEDLLNLRPDVDLANLDFLKIDTNVEPRKLHSRTDPSNLDSSLDFSGNKSNLDVYNIYPNLDLSNLDTNLDLSNCDLNLFLDFESNLNSSNLNTVNLNLNQPDSEINSSNLDANIPSVPEINPELNELITKQIEFLERLKNTRTDEFVSAAIHLCHLNTNLASEVWKDIFPKIWTGSVNLIPFICDRIHLVQKDCQPSAIVTFCEALADCEPRISMKPIIMKYLGKTYNMWHQMTLNIEKMITKKMLQTPQEFDFDEDDFNPHREILDSLADMYSLLGEDDMWSGLWKKNVVFKETLVATVLEQQGFFDEAQEVYKAVLQYKEDLDPDSITNEMLIEFNRCDKRWIRCAKELNQWYMLLEISDRQPINDPLLRFSLLEICFHTSKWDKMEEHFHLDVPSDLAWKTDLYRGYWSICGGGRNLQITDEFMVTATKSCIREWRRLPHVVGRAHIPLLQAAEELANLHDAKLIHQNLGIDQLGKLNKIMKTWKHRLPTIADDLNHWSTIFTWREQQYISLINFANLLITENVLNNSIHIWARSVNTFSKFARKQNMFSVAIDSLMRIDNAETVAFDDRFETIKQLVKCYVKMSSMGDTNRLQNALSLMESTEVQCFKEENISNFYALKGKLYTLLGQSDEANKAFSYSIEMNENNAKAWGFWGEYLESVFQTDTSRIEYPKLAVSCFLNACKYFREEKCRKYIAKILWFFNYDDEEMNLFKLVNNHAADINPNHWISWLPQLLKWLIRPPGDEILDLLHIISKVFPQAMHSEIRPLYMKLRFQKVKILKKRRQPNENDEKKQEDDKVLESVVKCSKIMSKLIIIHPTLISYLDRSFDQIIKLRENWLQEALKHLQQILIMSYRVAFDKKENISEAKVTLKISNYLKKIAVNVRREMDNISKQNTNARQSPVFQLMNKEFEQDFNMVDRSDKSVLSLIKRLKKWIVILEKKIALSLRSILLEKRCESLVHFNLEAVNIGLPGSTFFPKFTHYPVTIVKFMPWVDVIRHKCSIAHRLWILGSDGKRYSYLVVINDSFDDGSSSCRVMQLLQMLNVNLRKQKETSRRHLQFTIPKMVLLHPLIKLIEDNPNAITLLQIYKQICDRKNISLDAPISKYYELLSRIEARGAGLNKQDLKSIFHEVAENHVPKTILKDWAMMTFQSSTDYWTFRKMFMSQISMVIFSQYVFHLTKLNPDMMSLNPDSGIMNVNYFTFNIDDDSGRLDANEPVPFRLTPNIEKFITEIGVSGPLCENLIASARSLAQPSYQIKSILHAIIRDEIDEPANQPEGASLVEENREITRRVTEIVTSISTRLDFVGDFSELDSNVRKLLNNARNVDNLCQMDPSWYPWL